MAPIEIVTAGWYNFLYVLAIVAAAGLMLRAGRDLGWKAGTWGLAVTAWVMGGVLGSMIPHILLGDLAAARTSIGAIAGATLVLALAARALRFPVGAALDTTAIGIPLGAAIVRVGCFLAECCQGKVTSLPIGFALHEGEPLRHPVQLYEAGAEAGYALWLARWTHRGGRPSLALSIAWMSIIRFVTEFVRDNEKFNGLSLAQWIVLPLALICFAIVLLPQAVRGSSMKRATALPALGLATVLVGALALTSLRLPPLETGTLALALGAVIVLIAQRMRAGAPASATLLALQMPPITTDSTYPRVYQAVGAGLTMGSYDMHHYNSTCDGPSEDWRRHHSFLGGSLEFATRREKSATNTSGFHARGYFGMNNAGRATVVTGSPVKPNAHTRQEAAATVAFDRDWKYVGLSGGLMFGQFSLMDDEPDSRDDENHSPPVLPAIGLRFGPLAGLSVEMRAFDEAPSSIPGPATTISLGLGNNRGSRIRIGGSEAGVFVAGRYITRSGLEILPSMLVGEEKEFSAGGLLQGSVMIRKWSRTK